MNLSLCNFLCETMQIFNMNKGNMNSIKYYVQLPARNTSSGWWPHWLLSHARLGVTCCTYRLHSSYWRTCIVFRWFTSLLVFPPLAETTRRPNLQTLVFLDEVWDLKNKPDPTYFLFKEFIVFFWSSSMSTCSLSACSLFSKIHCLLWLLMHLSMLYFCCLMS